ncbi:unnamed protein product [Adineta steineri]|uniref:DAGKc domain-containing protein n=1 Tax=Adineta steineri TaxID=433720 RepID=A0A813S8V5_9BILA|nr:unnamed protein product [Adineta steineri]CAF3697601.1 unnamed protein product [Adineta steineri]
MSSRTHQHRPKSSVNVKQAFEEHENEDKLNNEEITDEHGTLSDVNDTDFDRFYARAFFTVNDSTVEVILDNDILSWSRVSNESSREESHQRKSTNKDHSNSIDIHDVYAILPVYNQYGWYLSNNERRTSITVSNLPLSSKSQLCGFQLYSYERIDDNILQEIQIIFQSTIPNQIQQWYELLSKIISEYKPSKNILVICNPYAGSKYSRQVYNTKIKPMLDRAQYNISYTEINEQCSVDDILNDLRSDLNSLYGLIIIGGDGSVIQIINALLQYLAKENQTRLDIENDLPILPCPICIIPTGTTNIICHSIHGNIDHCTPIFHLLFNQQMKIDMSAVFDANYKFVTANFSAGGGYPANALKYFTRYSSYSPKKILQKSFFKAASNKNLKPIEMEIRYIPADENSIDTRCYQGCSVCSPNIEKTVDQVKIFDNSHIQKVDKQNKFFKSKTNDNNRSLSSSRKISAQQNNKDKQWKILHHNYLHVAILTNANLWVLAPQGLSKFGHLADGLLDLILIEQTTRKEFLRFIKRNGNSKNQYEFFFTNLIKVKEIEIELKVTNNNSIYSKIFNTNNQLESDSSNEEHSDHENKSSSIQKHDSHPPNVSMSNDNRHHHYHSNKQTQESFNSMRLSNNSNHQENEDDNSQIDSSNSKVQLRRRNIFQSLKLKKDKVSLSRSSSAYGSQYIPKKENQQSSDKTLRPAKSFINLLIGGNSSSEKEGQSSTIKQNYPPAVTNERRSSVISRLSCVEYGKKSTSVKNHGQNKKQECMWNLDFTPYNLSLIRIKCFHRFLPVFGVGSYPDTVLKEIKYSCF